MSTVGVLHPGEMGAAVGAEIRQGGHTVLWCPAGRSEDTRRRAESAGLVPTADLADLLARSDIVLSICPPAAAGDVARRVGEIGYRGVFVDANAVSPALLDKALGAARDGGASTVDASIIGPPPGQHAGTRLYLAGEESLVGLVAELVEGSKVEAVRLCDRLGSASALKMAFASFQKASRVLAAVAHALADQYEVTDAMMDEAERMPSRILSDRDYLPSVARRAWRWAPEMREIASTLDAAGLPAEVADAVARVLTCWSQDRGRDDLPTTVVLDHLREAEPVGRVP